MIIRHTLISVSIRNMLICERKYLNNMEHGLRTPNEGINKRHNFGPMWQTKYVSAVPMNLGLGLDFRPCSEGDFLTGRL